MQPLIQRYYDQAPLMEWARLEKFRTEYAVTLRALKAHLPAAPAQVLDCGGGPGRYAITLAKQGYAVTLFDLSPAALSVARTNAHAAHVTLNAYEQGTATDLARFADETFDVVLLLGPLYHLTATGDREAALREAWRVLKPGGVVVVAFIMRYAFLRFLLKEHPEWLVERRPEIAAFFETGVLPAPLQDGSEFIAYLTEPEAVRPLMEGAGFTINAVLGVEGLSTLIDDKLNQLQGPAWEAWVDLNYKLAADPSLLGNSDHLVCLAHK